MNRGEEMKGDDNALHERAANDGADAAGNARDVRDLLEEVEAGAHRDRCTYTHVYLSEE